VKGAGGAGCRKGGALKTAIHLSQFVFYRNFIGCVNDNLKINKGFFPVFSGSCGRESNLLTPKTETFAYFGSVFGVNLSF
jgi:hypothetical protein